MKDQRIYLQMLKESDITEKYVSYFQNPELTKYMYQTPRKIDRESLIKELNQGIETKQYYMYGIFDKSNDLCIGNIRIGYITAAHKISDLATFIGHPDYHGKGFAQEAISMGNALSFETYDLRKLHSGMFAANMASIMAYIKSGWVIEGRLRGQYWVDGQAMDRITVACFNPKYFSSNFIAEAQARSAEYLKELSL